MSLAIRSARPADAPTIAAFVRELADYERLADEATATDGDFVDALFGPAPKVFCEIAEWDGVPVGMAVWYYSFSTFLGRHGLYLVDLYVRSPHRGRGIGKALLATLAKRCVDERLGRFEWEVLDWNRPAIDVYEGVGARLMTGWVPVRLVGEDLRRLAETAP